MGDEAATWVGRRAVAWVIDEAPVPADLAFTLTVIARRCDDEGRGSYQSLKTIAQKAGKSEAQAARDIRRLRDLGLLLLGDQNLPEKHGVPRGQRPTVYDVPLAVKGPKPLKASKNPSGRTRCAEAESELSTSPLMEAPPASMHPPHGSQEPPRMEALPTPRMDASAPPASMHPKEDMNKTGKKTSISLAARVNEARRWLHATYGLTDDEADIVIAEADRRSKDPIDSYVRYFQPWIKNGTLADVVEAVQKAGDHGKPEQEPEPPPASLTLVHDASAAEVADSAPPHSQPPLIAAVRDPDGRFETQHTAQDASTGAARLAAYKPPPEPTEEERAAMWEETNRLLEPFRQKHREQKGLAQ